MASSSNDCPGSSSNEVPASDEQTTRWNSSNPMKRPREALAPTSSPPRDPKRVRKHARSNAIWDWEAVGVPRSNAAGPPNFEHARELCNASGVVPLASDLMDVEPSPQPVAPPPVKAESSKAPPVAEGQNADTKSPAPENQGEDLFSGIGSSIGRPRSAPAIIEKKNNNKKKDNRKATPPEIQPHLYEMLGHYAPRRRNRRPHLLEELSAMESRRSSSGSDTSLESPASSAYSHGGLQRVSFSRQASYFPTFWDGSSRDEAL